ncbi:MAG: hypothetical protein U0892_18850 [Pirellulales bacterium]
MAKMLAILFGTLLATVSVSWANDGQQLALDSMVKSNLWLDTIKSYDVEYRTKMHVGKSENGVDQDEAIICREMKRGERGEFKIAVAVGFSSLNRNDGSVTDNTTTSIVSGNEEAAQAVFTRPTPCTANYVFESGTPPCISMARTVKLEMLPVMFYMPTQQGPEVELKHFLEFIVINSNQKVANEQVKLWGKLRDVVAIRITVPSANGSKLFGYEILIADGKDDFDKGMVLGIRLVALADGVKLFKDASDAKDVLRSVSTRWEKEHVRDGSSVIYPAEVKQICYVQNAEWSRTTTVKFNSVASIDESKFTDEWFRAESEKLENRVKELLVR